MLHFIISATDQKTLFRKMIVFLLLQVSIILIGLSCSERKLTENEAENESFGMFKWRIIEPWQVPVETSIDREYIMTIKDMLDTDSDSPLGQYVTKVRELGFNGMAMYGDPEKDPEAWRTFSKYLKHHGIGMIIRREWHERESGSSWPPQPNNGTKRTSKKLCPYSRETQEYWEKRVEKDFEMFPDIAGYRMNGTEFYIINGAPWMCDCDECRKHTGRERTQKAITLIATLLNKHGATLFWETCQDDPWGQRHEMYYFRGLTGRIPKNAYIVHKRFYWDFHPGWPRHPLYDAITVDDQGCSPYITSIQEPGEYRGSFKIPWSMVDEWSDAFQDMVKTGEQGLWVMKVDEPDHWDHPLNMVNWYAIAEYLKNPHADPEKIMLDWASGWLGEDAAPIVVEVVKNVTEASRGMFEFDALWTACHSKLPTLEYLDSHLCGPYRQTQCIDGWMGTEFPLDMYEPNKAAELKANPLTRMVFNRAPITQKLKNELMGQKNEAVRYMETSIELWKSLKGKIDDETYEKIMTGLKSNLDDTIIFRYAFDMYMDWKLGILTDKKIDETLEACRGLKGLIVPNPLEEKPRHISTTLPETLKTFAEKIRRDIHEPWIEEYWKNNPLGDGVIAPAVNSKKD